MSGNARSLPQQTEHGNQFALEVISRYLTDRDLGRSMGDFVFTCEIKSAAANMLWVGAEPKKDVLYSKGTIPPRKAKRLGVGDSGHNSAALFQWGRGVRYTKVVRFTRRRYLAIFT